MAASTWEGCTLPDEQAAPEDTATPSRSKAITAVSAFMPGSAKSVVFGSLSASAPKITACGASRAQARFQRRAGTHAGDVASSDARAASAAAPKPAIAGDILRAGPRPALLPAALDRGLRDVKFQVRGPGRRRPLGRRSCAPTASEVGAERLDIKRNPPGRLDGIDMQMPPASCTMSAAPESAESTPVSLLASMTRNQRAAALRSQQRR